MTGALSVSEIREIINISGAENAALILFGQVLLLVAKKHLRKDCRAVRKLELALRNKAMTSIEYATQEIKNEIFACPPSVYAEINKDLDAGTEALNASILATEEYLNGLLSYG